MSLTLDLYMHERGKVYRAIYNLKRSIADLERITPRTPKIEATLEESKDLEKRLLEAVKNPVFIKNLTDKTLKQTFIKSKDYTVSQKTKRDKRQRWKGLTKAQIVSRNSEIVKNWKESKLTKHNFAKRQSKSYGLSITQIKNIIKPSE